MDVHAAVYIDTYVTMRSRNRKLLPIVNKRLAASFVLFSDFSNHLVLFPKMQPWKAGFHCFLSYRIHVHSIECTLVPMWEFYKKWMDAVKSMWGWLMLGILQIPSSWWEFVTFCNSFSHTGLLGMALGQQALCDLKQFGLQWELSIWNTTNSQVRIKGYSESWGGRLCGLEREWWPLKWTHVRIRQHLDKVGLNQWTRKHLKLGGKSEASLKEAKKWRLIFRFIKIQSSPPGLLCPFY